MTGAINEVVVVVDQTLWSGNIGRDFRALLTENVPGIAWKEPIFDLVQIPQKAFKQIFQTHRNLIIIERGSQSKISFQKNVYSKDQLVVIIQYQKAEDIQNLLVKQGEMIVNQFQKTEKKRLEANMSTKKRFDFIFKKHGYYLRTSEGFLEIMDTLAFSWLEHSPPNKEIIKGIFMYDVLKGTPFNKESLLGERNRLLKEYVHGVPDGAHMITDTTIIPLSRLTTNMGFPTIEIKGIWKMEGGFMGGSFVSHYILDTINEKILAIDGFLFNPGENKRDHLQELQVIIESARRWPKEKK